MLSHRTFVVRLRHSVYVKLRMPNAKPAHIHAFTLLDCPTLALRNRNAEPSDVPSYVKNQCDDMRAQSEILGLT